MNGLRKAAAAAAVGIVVLVSGVAGAQPYVPALTIAINDSTVVVGQTVTVTTTGWVPNTSVSHQLNPPLGTTVADASGVAVLTTQIPNVSLGAHQVCATGTAAGGDPRTPRDDTICTAITVGQPAAPPSGGAGLPKTGSSNTVPLAQIGVVLVVAGGLTVLGARKARSRRHAAAAV